MGLTYSRARESVLSCRAKQQQEFAVEKDHHQPNDRAARTIEPITEAVKYALDRFSWPSAFPRMVLKRTEPPIPIRSPKL